MSQVHVSTATMQHMLSSLMSLKFADPFLEPVDWKAWGLLDYPQVIKKPMDLGTIEQRLNKGEYNTVGFDGFIKDIQLVIDNCITYNDKKSEVARQAVKLQKALDREISKIRGVSTTTTTTNVVATSTTTSTGAPVATLIPPTTSSSSTMLLNNNIKANNKAPSGEEKDKFCKMVFQLRAADLGKVVELLDELCPAAIERTGKDEIDVNVDVIDTNTFRKLELLARESLSKDSGTTVATTNKKKKSKTDGGEDEVEEQPNE